MPPSPALGDRVFDTGAVLDIPERFNLVFKADDAHIPCHVIWRQEERIGVAFD